MRRLLAALTLSLSLAACSRHAAAPSQAGQPPSGGAPVQEGPYCAGKTCGACVGEAGCWWCPSLKRCVSDQEKEQKVCPDANLPHDEPDCPK